MVESEIKRWTLDNAHSSVEFVVRHMMISNVRGSFKEFSADIKMDPNNVESAAVTFVVKVDSVDTNQKDRDEDLKSSKFFDVTKYPDIKFTVKNAKKTGNKVEIRGDLTIKDVTKEIQVVGELDGPVKDPYGKQRIGFEGETTINRKDFGLTWNMILEGGGVMVGETVRALIRLEAYSD